MSKYANYASFLFAQPSLLEGCGRIWDFGATLNEYNRCVNPDLVALYLDWQAIGDDLQGATVGYVQQQLPEPTHSG
jgi:hypothetical protein